MNARYAVTPPTPDEVTRAALAALGPGEAGWLVGGCLRDELLGRRVRDIDMVVDGRQEALARALADRFQGAVYATSDLFGGWRVVVGDLHGCYACLKAVLLQSDFFGRVARFRAAPDREPDVRLIFLGDFLDRGVYGLEGVLRTLVRLFVDYPEHVIPLVDNHE